MDNPKKTIDQVTKVELLQELYDRFGTSTELQTYLNRINSCCGKCCQTNCNKLNCSCKENECCSNCPTKK